MVANTTIFIFVIKAHRIKTFIVKPLSRANFSEETPI